MIVTKIFRFDSAHNLKNYKGDCANLHGHTYVLHVSVKGDVNPDGFVMDFKDLNKTVRERVISKLDHKLLNDVIEQPTAENICLWIADKLSKRINLYKLKLFETPDSYVEYYEKNDDSK